MAIAPPRPKTPPLNSLRAFEAAARLGGFSIAADELCVTPGAVAQHIKALEAWAGAELFERRSQGVVLTTLGASVIKDFSAAFDHLGAAVQNLRSRAAPQHIRIAALPSVAQLWLSPRLPAIRSAIPDITISVTAMEVQPNLQREPFDLCIFFEDTPVSSDAIEICRDSLIPVCAPAVAEHLQDPSDLAKVTCLHDASWAEDWSLWISSVTEQGALDTQGPVFSLYGLAVEEARNGAGVLIGHEPLVHKDLENGSLVIPFEHRLELDRALTIRVAKSGENNPALQDILHALKQSAHSE